MLLDLGILDRIAKKDQWLMVEFTLLNLEIKMKYPTSQVN